MSDAAYAFNGAMASDDKTINAQSSKDKTLLVIKFHFLNYVIFSSFITS
jgi:hypothetical protein